MLYYVATRRALFTMKKHLRHYGREIAGVVRTQSYSQLFRARTLPRGAYVFADVERLGPAEIDQAAHVRQALVAQGCIVLNDPVWSMRRYELLRTMHDLGVNTTNVYHATENRQPARYPVFVRNENDHGGNRSPLVHSRQELDTAIGDLARQGISREQLLITEFCDTQDAAGIYRKYSAFIVHGEVIPRHEFFGRSWMLKSPELCEPCYLDEEFAYHEANPHEQQLRAIFTAARIDYGRIDYGVESGVVRVWEINTNPMITTPVDATIANRLRVQAQFAPKFNRALKALVNSGQSGGRILIPARTQPPQRRTLWRTIAAAISGRAA